MVGNSGDISRMEINGFTSSWVSYSYNLRPLNLNDIYHVDATNIYAVGNNGAILQSTDGYMWQLVPSGTRKRLNTTRFGWANQGMIGGEQGYLARLNNTGVVVPVSTGITANITDLKLGSGTQVFATTENSQIIQVANISSVNYFYHYVNSTR